jgi:rubrerythrin
VEHRPEESLVESEIESDLVLLRTLMARELETINHYRALAALSEEGDAREFFLHIIEEEKIHVVDVLRAITLLDADQESLLSAGYAAGHAPGEIPTAAARPAPVPKPEPTQARAAGLTVGSLKGMRQ